MKQKLRINNELQIKEERDLSRKDRYTSFKTVSDKICKMINACNFCGAWEYYVENNNEGFPIQELLRFRMERYTPNELLSFAEQISLDQMEIEQYKLYFQEKSRRDSYKVPSTAQLDPILVLSEVAKQMEENPLYIEYYISYINFYIAGHKDNILARLTGYIIPVNREKLYKKHKKIFEQCYLINNKLRAFRMNFCDFCTTDKGECICEFKNRVDMQIEIATREADIIANMYSIAYTIASRRTVQEFVAETMPAMHNLLALRKWYGYENYTFLDISIEIWIKAYLCLLFKSAKAIEETRLFVRIMQEEVEADFSNVVYTITLHGKNS